MMLFHFPTLTLTLAAWLLPVVASANDAYRCRDDSGQVVYANVPQGDACEKIDRFVPRASPEIVTERFDGPTTARGTRRSGTPPRQTARSTGSRTTTASANQVAPKVQMTRDQKRRAILTEELDIEQKNLADAKKRLAEQEAQHKKTGQPADALTGRRRQVAQHERNVEAIKRELARIPQT